MILLENIAFYLSFTLAKKEKRGNSLRKYLIALMVTTFIGGFGFLFLLTGSSLAVIINNQTDQEISGLTLTYENIKTDIEVDPIAPGDDVVLKIDPETQATEDFNEAGLELQYEDDNGKVHSESVIGYFEKGYSGDSEVTIKSIDENGMLEVIVEEDTALY